MALAGVHWRGLAPVAHAHRDVYGKRCAWFPKAFLVLSESLSTSGRGGERLAREKGPGDGMAGIEHGGGSEARQP